MTDPLRWKDDPSAPGPISSLLRIAEPTRPYSEEDDVPTTGVKKARRRVNLLLPVAAGLAAPWFKGVAFAAVTLATYAGVRSHLSIVSGDSAHILSLQVAAEKSVRAGSAGGQGREFAGGERPATAAASTDGAPVVNDGEGPTLAVPQAIPESEPRAFGPKSSARARQKPVDPTRERPAVFAPPAPSVEASAGSDRVDGVAPVPTPNHGTFADDTLVDEVSLLRKANAALATSPAAALEVADSHASRFPSGRLAAERELIRIDALLRLGRADEARRHADILAANDPGGLYKGRAQRLFDGHR